MKKCTLWRVRPANTLIIARTSLHCTTEKAWAFLLTRAPTKDWSNCVWCAGPSHSSLGARHLVHFLAFWAQAPMGVAECQASTCNRNCYQKTQSPTQNCPNGRMTFIQGHTNVNSTSWRCIDTDATLLIARRGWTDECFIQNLMFINLSVGEGSDQKLGLEYSMSLMHP